VRINIGCGYDHREGFLSVDREAFHRPHVVADVRDLPFRSGSCEYILALDLLEHMPRADTVPALAEWSRVVTEDGVVDLKVPDLRGLARMVLASSSPENDDHLSHLYYGTQAYGGDFHQAGFTDATLVAKLAEVGLAPHAVTQEAGWMLRARATRRHAAASVSYVEGFHDLETGNGHEWVWASGCATLRLLNPAAVPVPVVITGELLSHSGLSPRVTLRAGERVLVDDRVPPSGLELAVNAVLDPGVTVVPVVTDAPPIDPELDGRDLRVAFQDVRCLPV
jgi:predicted SAM-dependent methyltransferase